MDLFTFTLWTIKYFIAALMLLVVVFFVLIPLYRGLRAPIGNMESSRPKEPKPLLSSNSKDPPPERDKEQGTKIVQIAKQSPIKTAQIIRHWLKNE